jgi:uncharacterized membrane protein
VSNAGYVHTAFGLMALALGAAVFALRKGTPLHRALGYGFVASLLGLHGTAFMMYRAFGGLGLFHALSVVNLATLAAGLVPAYRKKPAGRWLRAHYTWMGWTYAGLLAATAAEITRLPVFEFKSGAWWAAWAVASFGIGLSALYLVYRYREGAIRRAMINYDEGLTKRCS